jgi:hypothetical protein
VQAHVLIGRPFREQDGSCVFATFVERSHTAQTSTSVRPRDGGSTLPNDRTRSGGNVAETRLRSLCSAATFMGYAIAILPKQNLAITSWRNCWTVSATVFVSVLVFRTTSLRQPTFWRLSRWPPTGTDLGVLFRLSTIDKILTS